MNLVVIFVIMSNSSLKQGLKTEQQFAASSMYGPTLNRMQLLDQEQVEKLHNSCMEILASVGIVFHDPEAVEIFKHNGFQVDGNKVFFTENQVLAAPVWSWPV